MRDRSSRPPAAAYLPRVGSLPDPIGPPPAAGLSQGAKLPHAPGERTVKHAITFDDGCWFRAVRSRSRMSRRVRSPLTPAW
jgi:hypothetical protein